MLSSVFLDHQIPIQIVVTPTEVLDAAFAYHNASIQETFAKLVFFLDIWLHDWCLFILRQYTCTC